KAPIRWRPQPARPPLPATTTVAAVTPPPRPADEENPSVAMHKVTVMKAVLIAGTTSPGSDAATVPGSHVPAPRVHASAASKCGTVAATPTTSHVTSTTASATVSDG